MKTRLLIIIGIITTILVSLLVADQYYLSLQDKELKKSDWVQNCIPVGPNVGVPSIGLFNHTHSFDLQTCSWNPTEHGAPGFLESLYTSFIEPVFLDIVDSLEMNYAHASCAAPILGPPGPCFDAYHISDSPLTKRSIMEDFARNIETNYEDWQMSDRNWDTLDGGLQLPAIICTEFVTDGMKQYRMAKWVDSQKISSFENHRNDWLCNKWLPPIDDGIKIKWDKPNYFSNDTGIVQVIDKDMNLDDKKIDYFDIHVFSDTDHKGIQIIITETDVNTGVFTGTVFFSPIEKSDGDRLLVEDAVYAEHKENRNFSRIIDESESKLTNQLEEYENPNECWYQEDDGSLTPCKIDDGGLSMMFGLFVVVFWPYIILVIAIVIIFFIWRKRK